MAQSQAFTLLPDPFRLDSSGTMTVATASTQTNCRVKFDYETHSVESAKFPPDSPFYFPDLFPIVPEDQVSCIRDNKLPETVSSPGTGHVTRMITRTVGETFFRALRRSFLCSGHAIITRNDHHSFR